MSDDQLTVETNEWATAEHATAYLARAHLIPRRETGYDELLARKWREMALLSGVKP